jgi:hypothetical protein
MSGAKIALKRTVSSQPPLQHQYPASQNGGFSLTHPRILVISIQPDPHFRISAEVAWKQPFGVPTAGYVLGQLTTRMIMLHKILVRTLPCTVVFLFSVMIAAHAADTLNT